MLQPCLHTASVRGLGVDPVKRLRQWNREPRPRVEMDPDARDIDEAVLALEARTPLGPEATEATAPRTGVHVVAPLRETLGADAHPAHDPCGLVHHVGVLYVRERELLHPARDSVQAHAPALRGVRELRPQVQFEDAPGVRERHDLARLRQVARETVRAPTRLPAPSRPPSSRSWAPVTARRASPRADRAGIQSRRANARRPSEARTARRPRRS